MITDISKLTLSTASEAIGRHELSSPELTDACLRQIDRYNSKLQAFITVLRPEPGSTGGILAGIPIALKDLFDLSGIPTTAGSSFFKNNIPSTDAPVVARLKQAGALVIGKTNLHEIALGVTNDNPFFGTCRNPWDMSRTPGGSSGGSAVAVATGMALGALGTDTGGSIRIPASLCGIVGLKPTFGRVSLRGVIPLSWNLDHAGPMARTVRDTARILQVIAGFDPQDPGSVDQPVEEYLGSLDKGVRKWRIALAAGEYFDAADPQVTASVKEAARLFADRGAKIEEVDMSFLRQAAVANGQMTVADAAAFHRERITENPEDFGKDVLERLQSGVNLTSTEYARARRSQAEMRLKLRDFFATYDALLTPTTPIPAPEIEGADAVEQARRLTRFTAPFNLTGLPALSLPCGFTTSGLPIGLQIVGRAWGETKVLQAAQAFETAAGIAFRFPLSK